MKVFELNKAYEEKDKQKVSDVGAVQKSAYAEDSMALLSRQFAKYLKQKQMKKENRKSEEVDNTSKNIQCFECKGFEHIRSECVNLLKTKKKALTSIKKSATGPTTESAIRPAAGSVAKSTSESENSLLTKDKVKLEPQVAEAQKYAVQFEEETTQARFQLEETQKQLRMLNNGTNQLDHLLNIGKSPMERHGLVFNEKSSKTVFLCLGEEERLELHLLQSQSPKLLQGLQMLRRLQLLYGKFQSAPRLVFQPVCHHCGVVGHIRPRCFKLLKENNQMEQASDGRFCGPTCYRCGVQGHVKRHCFRNIQRFSDEGLTFKHVWVKKMISMKMV
ncbi:unnamed protein product [Arabis nemorensis]|uniref:CCHC-type domain-containing protein n=1 Tax=Arabis nemorensis TaxID=586526 RepID=A0A565CAF9_9BRAS|nr:unnamed protein product [Arabis nemorensis]